MIDSEFNNGIITMKIPDKKKLRKRLIKACDKLAREIVFKRDVKCQRCGNTKQLQWCHIYSRIIYPLRWDADNSMVLCAGCHFNAHQNPLEFSDLVRDRLGTERLQRLSLKRSGHFKTSVDNLELLKIKLKQELEG